MIERMTADTETLLGMSRYLISPIFGEWIAFETLLKFDSAVCNIKLRAIYLDMISSALFLLQSGMVRDSLKNVMITWTTLRDVGVGTVKITDSDVNEYLLYSNEGFSRKHSNRCCGKSLSFLFGRKYNKVMMQPKTMLDIVSRKLVHLDVSHCCSLLPERLDALTKVCVNLRVVDLSDCDLLDDGAVTRLANRCPLLRDVNVANCVLVTDAGVDGMVRVSPNLTALNLYNCFRLTDESLVSLATHAIRLYKLNVGLSLYYASDKERWQSISKEAFDAFWFAFCCATLQTVCVDHRIVLTSASVAIIARNCPQLVDLQMAGVKVSSKCYKFLFCTRKKTRQATISHFGPPTQFPDVTGILSTISGNCLYLKSLTLNQCSIDSAELSEVFLKCTALCTLTLSGCRGLTQEFFAALHIHARRLTALSLIDNHSESGNEVQQITLSLLPSLTTLHIVATSDLRIGVLVTAHSLLTCKLTSLRVCHERTRENLPWHLYVETLTNPLDNTLLGVLCRSSSAGLTSVTLSHCNGVTDSGIRAMLTTCRQLTAVHISDCMNISTDSAHRIVFQCNKRLTSLTLIDLSNRDVNHNIMYTLYFGSRQFFLSDLANHCPNLTQLNLSGCDVLIPRFSNSVVYKLVTGCANLRELRLGHTTALRVLYVHLIAQHCQALILLDISNSPRLTKTIISSLKHASNTLRQVMVRAAFVAANQELWDDFNTSRGFVQVVPV